MQILLALPLGDDGAVGVPFTALELRVRIGDPLILETLTWPAVQALVEGGETLCLLPVGATEQHGRHLPLCTDSEIATAICRAVSEHTGVPVLPTLTISSSHAHSTKWPGTLSYPPTMVIAMVVELWRWIAAAGLRRLLILNARRRSPTATTSTPTPRRPR